ncbi:hypothetical protein G6F35_017131 [Rhizopus arrhizus]|nr:hypothetical protein G6F35_017131 [Rhizopus arrhizus]
MVISASTSPPIAPPIEYSLAAPMTSPYSLTDWFQAKAAVSTASSSRMPVLLAVPLRVITWPGLVTTEPLARSRKVDSERAGLPLRMRILRANEGRDGHPADVREHSR